METEISEANSEDLLKIAQIGLEAFSNEFESFEEAEKAYKGSVIERWKIQIEQGHARILVARVEGEVVGFLVFRWWFGWNGWLETIAVAAKWRRRGLGTKLIRGLIDQCRKRNYKRICFALDPTQELIEFYTGFGSKKFGEIPFSAPKLANSALQLYYMDL